MHEVTVVKEYQYGKMLRFDTGSYKFEAYVPNNVSEDTNVMIYEHGSGEGVYTNNWNPYAQYLTDNDCDSIIIRSNHTTKANYYNDIVDYYNLNSDTGITVSFSGGTPYALQSTAEMIQQNPGCSSPVAVVLDGYAPAAWLKTQGVVDSFIDTDTVILAFCQNNKSNKYLVEYENMAKLGVNVLILQDTSEYGTSHSGVNKSFLNQGLNDYATGKGALPDNYIIKIYDSSIGDFRYLNHSDVQTLNDVYKLFNVDKEVIEFVEEYNKYTLEQLANLEDLKLRSEDKDLENYLNGIRSAIRSSSVSALNCGGFSSSTMMPSQVPAVISRYLQSTTSFLSKLANETNQFAKIGESINEMNFNLEREACEINDIDLVQTIYAGDNYVKTEYNDEVQINEENVKLIDITNNKISNTSIDDDTKSESVINKDPIVASNSNRVVETVAAGSVPIFNTNKLVTNKVSSKEKGKNSKKIVSDKNRVVYECENNYKVIIRNKGDEIIGFEHYYDFNSKKIAEESLKEIEDIYVDNEFFDKVILDGSSIRVLFKKDIYEHWTLDIVEKLYNGLDGYKKL